MVPTRKFALQLFGLGEAHGRGDGNVDEKLRLGVALCRNGAIEDTHQRRVLGLGESC